MVGAKTPFIELIEDCTPQNMCEEECSSNVLKMKVIFKNGKQ